jgi:hypothetical protein
MKKNLTGNTSSGPYIAVASIMLLGLFGCSSDGETEEASVGYVQLYNASKNSPAIYLTVDKENDDDYEPSTLSGVVYGKTGGQFDFLSDIYDIELAWRDEDDITDLETIYQTQVEVSSDSIQFIVISEDISQPNVLTYELPIIDDESDEEDELFNLRFLNMHSSTNEIDLYILESDETFNESTLLGQYAYTAMSENQKIEQDGYVFYITFAGDDEVLYRSDEMLFNSTKQYVILIRENEGVGTSPFTIDRVANSIEQYPDADAESRFRIYNAVTTHELLENFQGNLDLYLDGFDDEAELSFIEQGHFSESVIVDRGDYSITLAIPENDELIIENHLLTLESNNDKSIFFYLLEEAIDEDGDGDVDEDGDGIVDEIEIMVNSLIVENSHSFSIYSHNINVINLIDDFDSLSVYFVLSDETTATANSSLAAPYAVPKNIPLRNNTYQVYMIGKEGTSDLILGSIELSLDEDSRDMFLILEQAESSSTGYVMKFVNQLVE